MGDFLSDAELASYLQVPSVDTSTADLLIGMAEASVRAFCGWKITEETLTSQVVEPVGGYLFLPTLRLTAVASVVENGATLTVGTGYRWRRNGTITRVGTYWHCGWQSVVVTYTHGYAAGASELSVVKQVVAAAVGRLMDRADQLASVTVGGVSESFVTAPNVPAGLLYNEQAALAPFVLPVVA